MKKYLFSAFITCLAIIFVWPYKGFSQVPGGQNYIAVQNTKGSFQLSAAGRSVPVYTADTDYPGVKRAVNNLLADITSVTGSTPALIQDLKNNKFLVLIGTLGKNPLLDQLASNKKIDVAAIAGKWEAHLTQVVQNPFPGVKQALIIAGSDKRGTIYGVYDLSAQIGVSPWNWWADVPAKKKANIYVLPGRYTDGEPAVKYRGIFINDEAPAFSGWARAKFDGVNHQVYEKVFELILRLKGNYLWPAMWDNAFNDDDKLNPVLADEYGIVMGTSHHEPMDRAQKEWKRYGEGDWNYQTNENVLKDFWKKGIQNMGDKETIVNLGMRGDGDTAMSEGGNISLLEKIVKDQRQIITDVTGKEAVKTPQMWALYKEVQDYYDKGMRVPDDVTLLLCDDNWGNIRKLPALNAKPRKGGYGIYFHFDYVGGPRNYKWLNTNQIAATWEQMHLAYEYNARQVWIVNVGDLKPMEFPVSFFLDYAWSPDKWPASKLSEYTRLWASQQFGPEYASEIAEMLNRYSRYNNRRKPELLDQNTYSLNNYREFETVVADYNSLKHDAEALYARMPQEDKSAFYQLVLHSIIACANVNEMYFEAAKNKQYRLQGRAAANTTANKVKSLFEKDKQISRYYNDTLSNGKWKHLMDQTHIGYTYWQQPDQDKMPDVKEITLPSAATMGVAIEGSANTWGAGQTATGLPEFCMGQYNRHYIEVFNRGKTPFIYTVKSLAPYLKINQTAGPLTEQERVWLTVDWAKVPQSSNKAVVTIIGLQGSVMVNVKVSKPKQVAGKVFLETDGFVSIEAAHYSKAVSKGPVNWLVIPNYGRTLSGVCPVPVTAPNATPGGNSPHVEYNINFRDTGTVAVNLYISPTLDFKNQKGLRYAVSIDHERPQLVNINDNEKPGEGEWNNSVANNIKVLVTKHHISKPGIHILKYWKVDAGVVLQKIVIDTGGLKESYLGPPGQ
ncbi:MULTISPECIES: glycosyl hydrolase 115 family protein [unclassified Mucilaginibacter]|uniref:glycosyl hydrolase 115 family protein n=1 Tax=unclassified Mucilaginibacter TaxID=2617802 RepID=UPI002AC89AC0|nr:MULTISPECIES: glycosyl hydrolase 115 family protein [unclassified Mucilaginibacter]MEB0260361.1 glycosyl hydrolase 115 family protein [Mucilaginibacter sp. 10I4]MEB0279400.1 glycosyl hydrolase 115 family protein [Mucilaginibacter sp. 10B2]MEB0300528.1 glycosyl hydrolase 115 family protein [Mucilaginibacter sp. 5C4]WPX21774.1 glycosyl hydrolase 115 family protein [Mucilaginibacter sp. 5C4]